MTFKEALDKTALAHNEKNFDSIFHGYKGKHYMYMIMNEAAELYIDKYKAKLELADKVIELSSYAAMCERDYTKAVFNYKNYK